MSKPTRINTIQEIVVLSRPQEVAFCSYNGFYMGKVKVEGTKGEVALAPEVYLQDKNCLRGLEYATDKLVVCVSGDESVYLIDRTKKQVPTKIKMNCPQSYSFELKSLPKMDGKRNPYVLLRDD